MKYFSKQIALLDNSAYPLEENIVLPFAFDDVYCKDVGNGATPMIHIWRHQRAFVLGSRDRKLPNAQRAIEWLHKLGYESIVRNTGGAAVPLDKGVLNISVILPKLQKTTINDHYEWMYQLIKNVLLPLKVNIRKGEISGSYCPGEYDLSINGKKFCGIAQRRQQKSVIIQAFVNIEGNSGERAEIVKRFYQIATSKKSSHNDYPVIDTAQLKSISEIIENVKINDFLLSLRKTLDIEANIKHLVNTPYTKIVSNQELLEYRKKKYSL